MLSGLSHNTVGSGNYQDSAVHLSSTGDHVLNVVSMSGAVNVCIVSVLGLVLNVSGRDRDSTLSLLGSFIDVLESNSLTGTQSLMQGLGDSSG